MRQWNFWELAVPAWSKITVAFKVKVDADIGAETISNVATADDGSKVTTNRITNYTEEDKVEDKEPDTPKEPDASKEPDTPKEPDVPKQPTFPQTGDATNLKWWFALLLISGLGVFGTISPNKKRKESK